MVETTKNRECGDCSGDTHHIIPVRPWFGDLLLDALMRSRLIEVLDVFVQDAPQVRLAHEQDVVQALTAQAADQALGDGVLQAGQLHPVRPVSKRSSRSRTPSIPGTGDASHCSTIGTTGVSTGSGSSTMRSTCSPSRRSGRASHQLTPSSAVQAGAPPSI
jgi:hypothetical protein